MPYARVALDVATRSLGEPFDYAVPPELKDTCVCGATVLVELGRRPCVGYVLAVRDELGEGLKAAKVKPVEAVLAPTAFDEVHAQLAEWLATTYAAPLASCVRLLLPPGQSVRLERSATGAWQLSKEEIAPSTDAILELTEEGRSFTPRKNASKQRAVLEALAQGPLKKSELAVLLPGSGACVTALLKKGLLEAHSMRRVRGGEVTTLSSAISARPATLTQGQQEALATIRALAPGEVCVLEGVTGSGKTEVYLQLIEEVLAAGKSAVVLVPEISLTPQTVGRFRSRFGDTVAVLHSKLSMAERFDQYDLVRDGTCRVVVGARSALFAPVSNLGLIVIDEEHETSYKQGSAPRYVARDVACELARLTGARVVLGSATPSFEARYQVAEGCWKSAVMRERATGAAMPTVEIADMREEFARGNRTIFSYALTRGLNEVLERKKKAVLLLNRRGFASFLLCRECGCVPECPHCATSLTYHERTHELMCHSCGRTWSQTAYPNPMAQCPVCGSKYLAQMGMGTQRVEDELKLAWPELEVFRMDADTTKAKGAHQAILEAFDAAECGVLVGTQMIAKGLDFPSVTLVGAINADTSLKLPDFRAAERTFTLLEQVAGRAGRASEPGHVVIQTFWAGHPVFGAIAAHDERLFVPGELEERKSVGYPPYVRLSNVTFTGTQEAQVERVATAYAAALRAEVGEREGWKVLGPAPCERSRLRDRWRWHVMLKSPVGISPAHELAAAAEGVRAHGVSIAIDIDAYDLA